MNHQSRITFNPDQCGGKPCIRGMRVRVKDMLEMLASGMTEAEILDDFDYLEPEDIRAVLEYTSTQALPSAIKLMADDEEVVAPQSQTSQSNNKKQAKRGCAKGKPQEFYIAKDFDAPLDIFAEYQ